MKFFADADDLELQIDMLEGFDANSDDKYNTQMICWLKELQRRRTLQSGNSGQVPAGHVLVPVEPTEAMCDVGHIGIDVLTGVTSDSEYYSTWGDSAAKLYRAMISAAPAVSDGWIPLSERMPEPGRWLALHGAPVYTRGPDTGKPWCKFSVGEGYLDKEDGKFYFLNWESPGEIGDSYNNLLAIATHWMYWELPDAPKEV